MIDLAHTCACGARHAEISAAALGVDLRKALDPTDPDDFDRIVGRLAAAMSRATRKTEAKILRAAINALDVDWPRLTSAQRSAVIRAARSTLNPLPAAVLPAVEERIRVVGPRTIRGVRRTVAADVGVAIGTSLSQRDTRIVRHLVSSQAHFIRDEYGRRRVGFSAKARSIVANGLDQGLGRDDIATSLEAALGVEAGLRRSSQYWQVIAGVFANRSRTYAQLASYEEAGIARYVFEAVLDERTTEQCRFMHGRVFNVGAALRTYDDVAASEPEAVVDLQPWIRTGRNDDGERTLYVERRDGARTEIATVERSGVGTRDDQGEFRAHVNNTELEAMGAAQPPLHALCRSTIVPEV